MTATILVADDDPHIREVIAFALERAGMAVVCVADGRAALARHDERTPDLVILDIGMPELDGLDTLKAIRRGAETPVILLTARDEEIDRVVGLELGSDDYVTKPFSPRELVARVRAILKRTARRQDPGARLAGAGLELDMEGHVARFDGRDVALTVHEFSILAALLRRPARAFTRDDLIAAAWPVNVFVGERTVDSHVRNLRAKLAAAGGAGAIETVRGIGYRLGRPKSP
ncbi:MAG: response regulator transcription factor [Rhizobiaceae bacterium]